jgi:hypothetical protein
VLWENAIKTPDIPNFTKLKIISYPRQETLHKFYLSMVDERGLEDMKKRQTLQASNKKEKGHLLVVSLNM